MDSKEEKMEAFRLFDFDNAEYKAFLRNVELPPGNSTALLKVQAKWYARTQDPDFQLEWLPSLAAAAPPPPQQQQPSAAAAQQQQQQQQPAPRPAPAAGGRPAGRTPQWEASRQLHLAILQCLILVFTVLYLQPLRPSLSTWVYGKLMMVLLVSQGLKVNAAHGWPQSLTSLAAWQQWLMRVMPTSDAQYFLLAFAAAGNKPVTAVLPPFIVLAAYGLAQFASDARALYGWPSPALWTSRLEPIYRKLQANKQAALEFNAKSEIGLGFMLVLSLLFPWRTPMLTFLVWQFLRMRYWSPDSAVYHRQVWANMDQLTAGVRQQFPLLQKAVNFGVGYFHQNRGAW